MVWADENSISDGCVIMTENNVVENGSTRKGTTKIDVSWQVKDELHAIKENKGHTSMDSVIRELLRRPKTVSHYPTMAKLENLER